MPIRMNAQVKFAVGDTIRWMHPTIGVLYGWFLGSRKTEAGEDLYLIEEPMTGTPVEISPSFITHRFASC